MNEWHAWGIVAVVALVTAALRFLPFALFRGDKEPPKLIRKLGQTLPYAVMGMLVVYCLRGTHFADVAGFLLALIACTVVALLHLWKRNTLLSIIGGTVCYMVLVQAVF